MGKDEDLDYEWEKEIEEFEKTKAGVKGLVDAGITKVPRFFISPSERDNSKDGIQVQIPVINFQGNENTRRVEIVKEIREALKTWGFFQMVNHGVPLSAMDAVLEGTRRFHEQPKEEKMDYHSSDGRQNVRFYTIYGHLKRNDASNWRDVLSCTFMDGVVEPEAIPSVCRNEITDYMKHMNHLRDTLSELLSKALGLSQDFLKQLQCMKSEYLSCLYYPPCPEPEKTFGTLKHSDPSILTVLAQDSCGGLQIHHDGYWLEVPPIRGALIANVGDLLQLISNGKFKSVEHRVLARSSNTGTRLSAACFFYPSGERMMTPYGPIEELVSEDNPALYRQVTYVDLVTQYHRNVHEGRSALSNLEIVKKD